VTLAYSKNDGAYPKCRHRSDAAVTTEAVLGRLSFSSGRGDRCVIRREQRDQGTASFSRLRSIPMSTVRRDDRSHAAPATPQSLQAQTLGDCQRHRIRRLEPRDAAELRPRSSCNSDTLRERAPTPRSSSKFLTNGARSRNAGLPNCRMKSSGTIEITPGRPHGVWRDGRCGRALVARSTVETEALPP
jgi:hypothetical protein